MTGEDLWSPGIGDPSLMGWLTVFAYLVGAIGCAWAGLTVRGSSRDREAFRRAAFWAALAVLMFFLCINKQLDLQTWFTQAGKRMARAQGWYEQRATVQAVFVVAVGVIGLTSFLGLAWFTRNAPRAYALALAGLAFLLSFVLIRAASFNHIDRLLNVTIGGARLNWVFELTGIGCILVSAVWVRVSTTRGSSSKI